MATYVILVVSECIFSYGLCRPPQAGQDLGACDVFYAFAVGVPEGVDGGIDCGFWQVENGVDDGTPDVDRA